MGYHEGIYSPSTLKRKNSPSLRKRGRAFYSEYWRGGESRSLAGYRDIRELLGEYLNASYGSSGDSHCSRGRGEGIPK